MILADTNWLLSLTVPARRDHDSAVALLGQVRRAEGSVVVGELVLAEYVWTLQRTYGLSLADAADQALELLGGQEIVAWDQRAAAAILTLMQTRGVAFTDASLAVQATRTGAAVATFDRRLQRLIEEA